MGCSKISCKREIYSDTGQPPRRKIKNKQSNFTPKGSRKGKTKYKFSRKKKLINTREKIK